MHEMTWLDKPDDRDFPAAADYLNLLADPHIVEVLTDRLRGGKLIHMKAQDVLRDAGVALLPVDNPHVAADPAKVKQHQPLSPIRAVRGDPQTGCALQIADGYHRVCASYHTDENTDLPHILAART